MEKKELDLLEIGLGAKRDKKDTKDYRISGVQGVVELPRVFCLENPFPYKNQFSRGSCTSQSQASHKERQEGIPCSARSVMAWTKELEGNKDYGATTRNTFKVVNTIGIAEESLCPEPNREMSWNDYIDINKISSATLKENSLKHKSQSYWRVDALPEPIKQTIFQKKNSVVISMAWYKEFMNLPASGILPNNFKKENYLTGHAVDLIGWDDNLNCCEVKNSWGSSWGNHGNFYLPYSMFVDVVWDAWTSLDIPAEMPVDLFYGEKRTWNSYLAEKTIAFNPWLFKKINRLPNNREICGLFYGKWSWESVFKGKVGDIWLKITKPEAIKRKIIDNNENLIS